MPTAENRIISRLTTDAGTIQDTKADITEVNDAARAMVSGVRQGVQLGIFAAQAMGFMIDQTLSLVVEALLLSIEVALRIQAATSIATFGITGFIQIGAVISMFILVHQIQTEQKEKAQQTQAIVSGLRMAGFRG